MLLVACGKNFSRKQVKLNLLALNQSLLSISARTVLSIPETWLTPGVCWSVLRNFSTSVVRATIISSCF